MIASTQYPNIYDNAVFELSRQRVENSPEDYFSYWMVRSITNNDWSLTADGRLTSDLAGRLLRQSGNSTSQDWLCEWSSCFVWSTLTTKTHVDIGGQTARAALSVKAKAAIDLINEWLADDSGYDDVAWPKARRAIEENRLSERSKFHE